MDYTPVKYEETIASLEAFDDKKKVEKKFLSKMCTDSDLMEQRNYEFGYNQWSLARLTYP